VGKGSLIRKSLAIGIILILIGVNVSSSFARDADIKTISPVSFDGNTLYVGGSGPNNYTRIQDAIDDSSHGDTVFVYSGYYTEEITIDVSINLIGENKDSTSIVGEDITDHIDVIRITADDVKIDEFTVKLSGNGDDGIGIQSDNNEINQCNIVDDGYGIVIGDGCKYNLISNCYFHNCHYPGLYIQGWDEYTTDNLISHCIFDGESILLIDTKNTVFIDCEIFDGHGIELLGSGTTEFINCYIHDNVQGIYTDSGANDFVIKDCVIENIGHLEAVRIHGYHENFQLINTSIINCKIGVVFFGTLSDSIISGCKFINNEVVGIWFDGKMIDIQVSDCHFEDNALGVSPDYFSFFSRFKNNNFINNTQHFHNLESVPRLYLMFHFYENNYWDDWIGFGPYHVFGLMNWEWHPASEPNDI